MAVRKAKSPSAAAAVRRGKAEAGAILAIPRQKAARERARAIAAKPVRRRATAAAPVRRAIPKRTLAAIGPQATGVLIAEGDSWFDYPMNDVLEALEDNHGFDVGTVAHAGDNVEDIAYSSGQFEQFARRLEKLLRQLRIPDAHPIVSGGGNDLAGDEFVMLLNHAASGSPTLNDDVVRGIIDVRLANAYIFLDQRADRNVQAGTEPADPDRDPWLRLSGARWPRRARRVGHPARAVGAAQLSPERTTPIRTPTRR